MNIVCFLIKDFILPVLIAYTTTNFALKDYKNKSVFHRQKELYLRFLKILYLLKKEPHQQFSNKALSALENMQSEFSIYSSKKCQKDFSKIFDKIQELHNDFQKNRDPNEDEIIDGDITSAIILQESYNKYKDKNQIPVDELNNLIEQAITNIQKSLGI